MVGTFVNGIAVLVGGSLGLLFNKLVPERFIKIAFQSIGLFTLVMGIQMALSTNEQLYVIFSLLIGSIIGEFLNLEQRLQGVAEWVKSKTHSADDRFTEGVMTAFLLFCMGSMTIMGAIQEGIYNNHELLFMKSGMDMFAALALASSLGIGVLFSVVPLFIYQGGLTLLAGMLQPYMTDAMMTELSAVGGILLMALALNILEIKVVKVMNMLPALIIIVLFMVIG